MFISNNRPSFLLWWKENLVKHWKVSTYYETNCRSHPRNFFRIWGFPRWVKQSPPGYWKRLSISLESNCRLSGYANIKLLLSNFKLMLHSHDVKSSARLRAIQSFIHVTYKVFFKCRQKQFSIKNSDSLMKLRLRYCNKLWFCCMTLWY